MHGASRWKDFSTADHLALELDAAWEQPKEEGNKRLKEGDHLGAAKHDLLLEVCAPQEHGDQLLLPRDEAIDDGLRRFRLRRDPS